MVLDTLPRSGRSVPVVRRGLWSIELTNYERQRTTPSGPGYGALLGRCCWNGCDGRRRARTGTRGASDTHTDSHGGQHRSHLGGPEIDASRTSVEPSSGRKCPGKRSASTGRLSSLV